MQRHSSYATSIPNMDADLDRSLPSFSRAVARSQQACDASHMLYGAGGRYLPDGDDVLHQDRTIPPLTYGHPMILTEYDQHFPSRLARTSAIVPTLRIHGTRDYAPDTPYLADDADDVEASVFPCVQQPPYACPLPDAQANTLDLINGVWHRGVQNVGSHDPLPVTSSTSHVQEHGGSSMVQHFQLPPHDARSLCADDAIQIGEPMWNTEIDRGNLFNLGTLGGPRGYQDVQTFLDANESSSPFSNSAPPPSWGPLTGAVPRPACTPVVPNIANDTVTNVGTIPLPLDLTALQPGGGDNCERMDGNCHASGKMALLSYSNEPWHQEQLWGSGTPTMSALPTYHVDSSKTATFFGHQDGVQRTPNYYDISQSYYPNAGSVIPAQLIPTGHLAQGDSGPFGGGASAVVTSASSVGSLATANMASSPSEASQTHPFSTQFTIFATLGPPQQTFGDLRPCPWKDDRRGICGEIVGWDCQDHLASAHGIVNISRGTLVTCGACGLQLKRKYLLRHFREVDLRFRRRR